MVEAEVQAMIRAGASNGLVTRLEARGFLSARQVKTRVRTGAWVRIFPGVYRLVGAPETWRQKLEALLLWACKGKRQRLPRAAPRRPVLSHKTAAALHGLESFPEGSLELTTTRTLRVRAGVKIHRVPSISPKDIVELDGMDVTSVPRTLIDLASESDSQTLRTTFDPV